MLISEAFDLFCQREVFFIGGSIKTAESYQNIKKLLIRYFGDADLSLLNELDFINFFSYLKTYQKPDTVRGNVVCVRRALGFINLSYPKARVLNPDTLKVPRRQKRIIKYLVRDEVDQFFNVVSRRSRGYNHFNRLRNIAIVKLLFFSGIRVSELCSLNRNSIKNRSFTIIGKSKCPRICFITLETQNAIQDYMSTRDDNNSALFITNYGNRITPSIVRRIFEFACKNSDFENITPHTLRHSFATYMLEKEVELCYISDLLGHQSLDTTRMYVHYNNKKLQHIYEKSMI